MSFGGVFASRKLQVILDLEKNMAIETDGYDVCVIGAGAAGIVLALDLAQRGARTLLLEAGGKGHEARSQDLYLGEISGIPYKGLYDGRFRTLGGTTTQWGGQILEIDDFIFQNRSWVDGSGWPVPKGRLSRRSGLGMVPMVSGNQLCQNIRRCSGAKQNADRSPARKRMWVFHCK